MKEDDMRPAVSREEWTRARKALLEAEGDADALLLEIGAQHLDALDHRVERGQPLLPIDDGRLRRGLLVAGTDPLQLRALDAGLPEEQESRRVAAI